MTNQTPPPCTCTPSNSTIQKCIKNFYDTLPNGEVASGVSVGVVDGIGNNGQPVVTKCYSGYANVANKTPISVDTVFEIGSVSKTFTTTMLATAVKAGLIDLNATAQSYYGSAVTLPVYNPGPNEVSMTMLDLADFTSGIPDKGPTNTTGPNKYPFSLMHTYLEGLGPLTTEPGTQYKYVNTNFGIIAELLMKQGNYSSYEDMLSNLIREAGLLMLNTGVITSDSPSIHNLAQGYDHKGTVQMNYALPTWPALQGAGGIYSTIDDMLQWLQFNMGLLSSAYNDLLPKLHKVWFPSSGDTGEGLGWFVSEVEGPTRIDKNGGTSGFHAYIGFLPTPGIGVVVLCNTSMSAGLPINKGKSPVDTLGKTILGELNS